MSKKPEIDRREAEAPYSFMLLCQNGPFKGTWSTDNGEFYEDWDKFKPDSEQIYDEDLALSWFNWLMREEEGIISSGWLHSEAGEWELKDGVLYIRSTGMTRAPHSPELLGKIEVHVPVPNLIRESVQTIEVSLCLPAYDDADSGWLRIQSVPEITDPEGILAVEALQQEIRTAVRQADDAFREEDGVEGDFPECLPDGLDMQALENIYISTYNGKVSMGNELIFDLEVRGMKSSYDIYEIRLSEVPDIEIWRNRGEDWISSFLEDDE